MPQPGQAPGRPQLARCPLCAHEELVYQFTHETTPIVRCAGCALLMRNPQPSDAELGAIYTDTYFLGSTPTERSAGAAVHTVRSAEAAAHAVGSAGAAAQIERSAGTSAHTVRSAGAAVQTVGSTGAAVQTVGSTGTAAHSVRSAGASAPAETASSFEREVSALKRATAAGYLDRIEAYRGWTKETRRGKKLLEIGSGLGNLLIEARERGYEVTGVEYASASVDRANLRLGEPLVVQGTAESAPLADESFDVCVFADVIEHTRDPLAVVVRAWDLLAPGGTLFVAVPSLDSWSAKLMRQNWMEFKVEHLFYFDSRTMESLLVRAGFEGVRIAGGRKTLSPDYVIAHFERFPVTGVSPMGRLARRVVPGALRRQRLDVVASGIDVLASKAAAGPIDRRRARISVVMPVYNERRTFPDVIAQLLDKEVPGADLELVIVESNSTDGTRDEVRRIEGHPRVRVIYEEKAKGKGHAVRTALAHATGDFVLIQDADLEYDLNDYEVLLEPLRAFRHAFVLGARHGAGGRTWKMRHFTDQVLVSRIMNLGHVLFTGLFNIVYGQRLRDPFTMYKVFRRDCLHGLTFESNRFDFDWELVGKLVRAGYKPIEIPVNYTSRSFTEGKKVSMWRDPLTWIRACFKYRFVRLGK